MLKLVIWAPPFTVVSVLWPLFCVAIMVIFKRPNCQAVLIPNKDWPACIKLPFKGKLTLPNSTDFSIWSSLPAQLNLVWLSKSNVASVSYLMPMFKALPILPVTFNCIFWSKSNCPVFCIRALNIGLRTVLKMPPKVNSAEPLGRMSTKPPLKSLSSTSGVLTKLGVLLLLNPASPALLLARWSK